MAHDPLLTLPESDPPAPSARALAQAADHAPAPITTEDLPALFQAADKASLRAQRSYLNAFRANLIALVVGALASSVSFGSEHDSAEQVLLVIGVLALAAGLVSTATLHQRSLRQKWYRGRAVAESAKTLAWRYMMKAEPFHRSDSASADALFVDLFRRLTRDPLAGFTLDSVVGGRPHISQRMREVRAGSLDERRAHYVHGRIKEQTAWYSAKAEHNEREATRFFVATLIAQLVAFGSAIAIAVWGDVSLWPSAEVQFVGVCSTIAGVLLAWTQVRRNDELAQSYNTAAVELGLIAELVYHGKTDQAFARFVADAESAVSREHTLWLARQDEPRPA